MGYIYLVTNKLNGYQYIGQTLRNDIETRWKQHKMIQKNTIGKYLFNAYNRYGIENFKFEIICICFDEDCNKYEAEYIKKFNTIVPNGYNLQSGGLNYKHHPETIEKMKISLKGKSGVIRDEKWRNNMKIRMSDSKNPNFGKKCQ
jgi:group I intron endonuclease